MQEEFNRSSRVRGFSRMIDGLVEGREALGKFLALGQEMSTGIIQSMALAGLDRHMELARLAVEETGRGVYEDKNN